MVTANYFKCRANYYGLESRASAFTLLELVVIVLIIAVLAAIALPAYFEYKAKSRIDPGQFVVREGEQIPRSRSQLADPQMSSVGIPNELQEEYRTLVKRALAPAIAIFNTPSEMEVEETKTIKLIISRRKTENQLSADVLEYGQSKAARIGVGSEMSAILVADDAEGLSVVEKTPKTQNVSDNDETYWLWDVRARKVGKYKLTLTISISSDYNGVKMRQAIKSHEEIIEVRVGVGKALGNFWASNWQWLSGTILLPLLVWAYHRRSKRKGVNRSWKPGRAESET